MKNKIIKSIIIITIIGVIVCGFTNSNTVEGKGNSITSITGVRG